MTKQEKKDAAWAAYRDIERPAQAAYRAIEVQALKAYGAEIKRIDNEPAEDIIKVDGKRYKLIK